MSSGKAYDIPHPEMAMVTGANVFVGVGELDEGIPEDARIRSLLQVTGVEPLNSAATEPGN